MRASSHTRRNKSIGGGQINGGDEAHGHRAKGQVRARARNEPPQKPEATHNVNAKERGSRHRRLRGRSAALDERAMGSTSTARTSSPCNLQSRDDGARRFARRRILERPLLHGVLIVPAATELVAHR